MLEIFGKASAADAFVGSCAIQKVWNLKQSTQSWWSKLPKARNKLLSSKAAAMPLVTAYKKRLISSYLLFYICRISSPTCLLIISPCRGDFFLVDTLDGILEDR